MNNKNQSNGLLLAYLALAAVCVVWGTTYLVLRIGVTQFPPFLFSMIRFLIAGPILIIFMLTVGKQKWPDRKTLFNQAVSGGFMLTLGISIVGWAEMYISSGVAAIICSMMPIWTVLINVLVLKDEKSNWLIALGLLTGLSGIILIFGEHLTEFSNSNYLLGIILTFAANLCWAIGSIWVKKKNQHVNPFLGSGFQMLFGGLFMIPLTLLLDDYSSIHFSNEIAFSLAYMILIGSVGAYACYSYAIKKLPMTLVSLYAYINPIVAVILGSLVLNEKLNLRVAIAILITIAGIYIVNRGYQLKNNPFKPLSGIRSLFRNSKATV
ncbi:MAG TPA: EamA family transporter [Cyclobacteriaceae bacterium]|jgi:drug/metabolite transporter (DMT)-like permease|nr:EamA family transporter [Cyclobacteriaceae bacterium]